MSLTINGTTNTLTAASGLTVAGNTAVTGTLSATDKLTVTSPATGQAIELRNRASDDTYSGIYFKTNDGVTDQTLIQNARVGTNGGRFLFYTKADGGVLTNNCILSSTGLAVTGTLSATDVATFTGGGGTTGGVVIGGSGVTGIRSLRILNSTATANFGVAGGGSDLVSTSVAGDCVINNVSGYKVLIGVATTAIGAFSSTGLAVTGTLSASGVTSILDTTDATSTTAASLKTAGGLAVVKKGYFGDNIVMASGKGIDFSATSDGSGTTTSEVLSDYEEGTWTPTLIGQTTAGAQTYTEQKGIYTKVGNLVTVHGSVTITAKDGAMAGNVVVGGLPFTVSNSPLSIMLGVVAGGTGITYPSAQTQISCLAVGNTTYMRLIVDKSNGGGGAYITVADIASTTAFGFSCTYRV